jgi:mono/diheme cytochrome c family protein
MRRSLILLTALVLAMSGRPGFAEPAVPGLRNNHPLSPRQVGDLLIGELRCVACHSRQTLLQLEKSAPDLTDVGSRVSPDFLRRFIASPSAVHAGTTMPDLLASEPNNKRVEIASAITHFLVAKSPHPFKADAVAAKDAAAGRALFHTVGCVACHAPRDENDLETTKEAVSLTHLPAKYSLQSLEDFLFQPTRVRSSGRMPDMKLTRPEARVIAGYLLGTAAQAATALKPDDALVAAGKEYFQSYNCAACHRLADIPATPAAALETLDPTGGCLADKPGKSPRFNLNKDQVQAIRTALAAKPEPVTDKLRIDMTLTAFNCLACHVRGEHGGVSGDRNELFQTDEKNLGDDARIPPQLTLVGAKLQTVWMQRVLFDGESVRPYMLTRMPQFGEANLRHLPELFARVDTVKAVEFAVPKKERERELRTAGHQLLGDKGLNCITCHNFNGKPSPGFKGIDLTTTNERLKPSWFYHFMRDPAAYRRGIIMPTYWPSGKAVRTDILNGDTDGQIEAMWYFLSLGTSANDPSGIRSVDTKLRVTDKTQTYRGRSGIAGYRGIAVGFPGGLNYAFNAETGTLTGLWRGDYINVGRGGQGSGGFSPAARAVTLVQDVSFCELPDEKAAWPLRPTMTKEAPVNPDPLYPRNHGYQFKGYYLDDASIPTFMYRAGKAGDIGVEDRAAPADAGHAGAVTSTAKPTLVRTLKFSSPSPRTIWFRALTGKVEEVSKQQFKTGEVQLSIPRVPAVIRQSDADKTTMELLLKLDLPRGDFAVTITYELLH